MIRFSLFLLFDSISSWMDDDEDRMNDSLTIDDENENAMTRVFHSILCESSQLLRVQMANEKILGLLPK